MSYEPTINKVKKYKLINKATIAVATWTIRTSAADNNWYSVCWSPELGIFCAVAYSGSGNKVMTSTNVYPGKTTMTKNIYSGYTVQEGTNQKQGIAVLVAGTLVVNNTSITANSRILIGCQVPNHDVAGAIGRLRISARTAGTSFTILSSSATDTSSVGYEIFEPA